MIDCMGIGDDPAVRCLSEYRFQNRRWHLLTADHLPQHIAGTDRWKLVSITYDISAQVPTAGDYFVTALTLGLNAESEVSAIVRCSPTPVR